MKMIKIWTQNLIIGFRLNETLHDKNMALL